MAHIFDIITEIKNNSSILKKLEIMENNKDNEELKKYFYYCLNKDRFGIKKIPEPYEVKANEFVTQDIKNFSSIENLLNLLSARKITGNKAIESVSFLLGTLYDKEKLQPIFINMLQKNPRCGVSVALVNRVWPNLIPVEIKLCKAQPYSEKNLSNIVYPAYSQRKCDGARCLAFCVDGDVNFYTSSGKDYFGLSFLADEVSKINGTNFVLDGELLVVDGNENVLSRKEGNGILNKSIHNTISVEESERVRFVVWDFIPFDEYLEDKPVKSYKYNFEYLTKIVSDKNFKRVSLVETKIVNDKNEAFDHFRLMLSRGEEGTIVKNMNMKWEGKRSKNCVKFKVVMQSTMKIIDMQEGTEKYTGKLGAIICESEDGKVQVKCGSGFSDEQREEFWINKESMIGHYVELASNGIIQAEDGTYSLFLPRFIEDRTYEKNEADTFEMIVALSNGSEMLK